MYGIFKCVRIKHLFLNLGKQRLKDSFLQNWCVELRLSIRALCYR